MASRSTLQKAQEVKAEIESRHPGIKIRITDESGVHQMGRAVAERKGFEIVEDNGGCMVTVKETYFDISEVRICTGCGVEILTAAIGEDTLNECTTCRERRLEKQEKELQASIERSRQRMDWAESFDEMWG